MWSVHRQGLVLAQSLIIECIVLGKGSVAVLFIEQKTPICINVCRGTRQPSRETRPFYLFARFMGIHHLWALQIIIEAGEPTQPTQPPFSPRNRWRKFPAILRLALNFVIHPATCWYGDNLRWVIGKTRRSSHINEPFFLVYYCKKLLRISSWPCWLIAAETKLKQFIL